MSTPVRYVVGLLLFAILAAGGFALLRGGIYGMTIFVLGPLFLGGLASWVLRPKAGGQAASYGAFAVSIALVAFLIVGMEGVICIAMTWPLAAPLGALGGWLVYRAGTARLPAHTAAIFLLLPPAGITWDTTARSPVYEVRTEVTLAATPQQVWKHVVTFSELPEPREWYFRAGLAFPKRARIEGSGVGATRYCEFSTGPFVEPIEIWNQPSLLRFRVTENRAPMREWSPYSDISPRHLHRYLVSKQGQFRLTRLANNQTLLEGTTWYQHGLWPAEYWRWWSDAIIHRIHLRVLNHIRTLAENSTNH